jgi:hypothetical protein
MMVSDRDDFNELLAWGFTLSCARFDDGFAVVLVPSPGDGDQRSYVLSPECRHLLAVSALKLSQTFSQSEIQHRQDHKIVGSKKNRVVSFLPPTRWRLACGSIANLSACRGSRHTMLLYSAAARKFPRVWPPSRTMR